MNKIDKEYSIVIVDDESLVTSSLNTLLLLDGRYTPIVFNSPIEALEYIKTSEADLVVSDFLMPEMNGIDFLTEVKKINPGASLILLTGYADKRSAIRAINELGLYRYIEKPWDNEDFLLCIKNGLERSHLLENLEQKINELSETKQQLENYNEQLEQTVKERTKNLVDTNIELEMINTKLGAIINHCADGIVTVSKDGIISQINPAMERISGKNQDQLSCTNFSDLFVSDYNEPICNRLDPSQDVFIRDYKLATYTRNVPVEISFAPIISAETTEITNYVGVIRDITLQYEMERLREDFIATLTHDLRTPLLAAIQTLKFFIDGSLGDLSEKQRVLLETMLCSNQDMLGLVNALLEVYKYESGQLVLCKDYFELRPFIEQCTMEVQSLVEQKNINLTIEHFEDLKVNADKQELRRVLANLLGNAINHTADGGSISVSVEFNDGNATITVSDTGMGIPPEDVPKLFNRFSQGTSKKRSTGTGLGLYLSRQIVEAHGGKIWFEHNQDQGSKFRFNINGVLSDRVQV